MDCPGEGVIIWVRDELPEAFLRPVLSFSIVALTVSLSGCASGFHQVAFASDVSSETLSEHPTVHVVKNVQMSDTVLEARIRAKLEEFLLSKGYVITSPDTAQLYVLATFGAGERMVASTAAVFRPAEVKVDRNADGQVIRRTVTPDRMEYLRLPQMQNSVWLQVLYSDAKLYRETGQIRNLWRGEAAMKGPPSSLSADAPFLLVPALKYFGKGTNDVLTIDVRNTEAGWF
jgi:hypothetical protein